MRGFFLGVLALLASFPVAADNVDALRDPWITEAPPSNGDIEEGWTFMPRSMFAFVSENRDGEALTLLEGQDTIAIDCKLATRLVNTLECPRHQNFKPYLVRAVELKQSLGSVGPFQKDGAIWISYLGPIEPGKLRHRAVVLYLRQPPKHLYITITLEG